MTAVTGITDTTKIIVHTTFLGGGLGRRIEQDYISQAIQVAMQVKRPVKLTWMREEDLAHDQYPRIALIRAKTGLGADNKIAAWSYRNVSPSILSQRGVPGLYSLAVEVSRSLHYNRGTHVTEWIPLQARVPVGFWRSVGSSINAFPVERMMDMLANAAGLDPFAFRYSVVKDRDDRARAVLEKADQLSAWRNSLPTGRAWGMALTESFGTLVCEVVEVSQPALGSLTVHRVACVVDCGTVINPGSVEAQMEGSIVHGLTAALWGQVTFTNGVANQTNINKYRMLRLNEMPTISVQIIASTNPPSGVGEPGVPPITPAVANAFSRLTGTQVTSLPLFPGATMSGI
ncbi:MAG: xanthine dehydrogenase family protein molybdopterin-binding subunit [Pedosphaera sp.]|nr:xanthine dehydrogenase family protein molybdopterin-binding subunit [Pedosphaera sp.]